MEKFSQRMGVPQAKTTLQVDSINENLRNTLWNLFWDHIRMGMISYDANKFGQYIWRYYFKKLLTEAYTGSIDKVFNSIKERYFTLEWYEVYDFIEFVAKNANTYASTGFVEACNSSLMEESSAYRFIGMQLAPVTSELEVAGIERAIDISRKYTPHLERVVSLLADKKSPDYANSIKESISAVEAICKLITGDDKATLGKALGRLENKVSLHPSLKEAFSKLYGYTSDTDGIRHALLGQSDLDLEDARLMLTECSAFVTYLLVKAEKAGIVLSSS